jgi:ectoine hydroxylase-related dioxygenase (phytanoyl-CoA dioxygenase family)
MMARLAELMGQQACLFKEKINYKLPGGAGFTAHQDAPAFDTFGHRYHVTVLVAVDAQTEENGCLAFAEPVPEGTLLAQRPGGAIDAEVEAGLTWRSLPLPAGSVVFFDSYIPHRSDTNRTDTPRRGLYVTYNRAADGDRRADYFAAKRVAFPPEIERVAGVDYLAQAGRYNVGNPIR